MTSWGEVTNWTRDEPVRGSVAEFRNCASDWSRAADGAEQLRVAFGDIVAGSLDTHFEGEAAQAFQRVLRDTKAGLDDVPGVCESLASILRSHASQLEALRQEADSALARAKVRWDDQRNSSQLLAADNQRLVALRSQIAYLRSLPPEHSAGPLNDAVASFNATVGSANRHSSAVNDASRRYAAELKVWDELQARENSLNKHTADSISDIDLRGLKDPGFWDQALHLARHPTELGAVLNNAILRNMLVIRELLDAVLSSVDILMLALIPIALVATAVSGGAALPFVVLAYGVLTLVAVAAASARLASSAVLWGSGTPDPVTGRPIGVGGVLIDGVDVAASLLKVRALGRLRAAGLVGYNLERALLKEELGLSFKHGYDVSWRLTTRRSTIQFGRRLAGIVGHDGVSTPTSDSAPAPIERDLSMLLKGNRGISDPTQCNLVPALSGAGGGGW